MVLIGDGFENESYFELVDLDTKSSCLIQNIPSKYIYYIIRLVQLFKGQDY